MDKTISNRLKDVLGGRKATPWGKKMGLNATTISGIFSGKQPGAEILRCIAKTENLSVTWLLEGKGAPYLVDACPSAEVFADRVAAHIEDQIWNEVHLLNAPNGLTVIFCGPAQYDYKGTSVQYQTVEIVTGPVSEALIEHLEQSPLPTWKYSLQEGSAEQIASGQVGTFGLFGDGRSEGILDWPHGNRDTELSIWDLIPQEAPKEAPPIDTRLMRAVIELVDNILVEEGIELDIPTRARVITAAYRSAEKKGEVDPITISAVIEASS